MFSIPEFGFDKCLYHKSRIETRLSLAVFKSFYLAAEGTKIFAYRHSDKRNFKDFPLFLFATDLYSFFCHSFHSIVIASLGLGCRMSSFLDDRGRWWEGRLSFGTLDVSYSFVVYFMSFLLF